MDIGSGNHVTSYLTLPFMLSNLACFAQVLANYRWHLPFFFDGEISLDMNREIGQKCDGFHHCNHESVWVALKPDKKGISP